MKRAEKYIEDEILTWLNQQPGTFAFKVVTSGFYDTKRRCFRKNNSRYVMPGTSDIIGTIKGKILAIECKSELGMAKYMKHPGARELDQILFLRRIELLGGIAMCVCSLDEVKARLLNHLNTQ